MRPGFWQYVRAAFNARPIGMFVPPNWIGLAAFGLLGAYVDPGFWVIGAGLELGYLSLLATNPRFQRVVSGTASLGAQQTNAQKLQETLASLPPNDRERYRLLEVACQSILLLQFRGSTGAPGYQMQAESLGRLTWMYLRLLATRQSILAVIRGPSTEPWRDQRGRQPQQPPPLPGPDSRHLESRLKDLRAQLQDTSLSVDLRRSLESQADLIEQRLDRRALAGNKLAFIEAELTRIEQQVELIREQAVLSTDPESFSHRIDEIGATLSGTGDWIAEQQRVLGTLDMLAESTPVSTSPSAKGRAKERQ